MSFTYRYRKIIIISVVFIISFSCGGFYLYKNINFKKKPSNEKTLISKKSDTSTTKVKKEEEKEEVFFKVDIKGEVNNPGIYSLKEGSRVSDVIELAGGLTKFGDTTVINLSKKIIDEMVIIIYSKYQVENFKETKEEESTVIDNCINSTDGIKNDACIESDTESEKPLKISINTATIEVLSTLPGIGESKAKNIIDYRGENGDFTDINDIKKVTGIGDAIFDQIKDLITL